MVGVGQNDLRAKRLQRFLRQALYRRRRAYRHEHRRFDRAVRGYQLTTARTRRILLQNFKRKAF